MVELWLFALGLCFGSFLNVCIYRMPREESVAWPASHCTKCQKPIQWFDNIPILSYVILKGKCRNCSFKISIQYPLVEFLGGLAVLSAWFISPDIPSTIMTATIFLALIVVVFVDFEHQIIPDEITLSGIVIGVIFSMFVPSWHGVEKYWQSGLLSVIGVLVGGGVILSVALLAEWLMKKEAMGGGDVKFLAACGALLGWQGALFTLFVGSFLGSFIYILTRPFSKQDRIPFGPYLTLGMVIYMFWGEEILSWYLKGVLQY